MCVVRPARTVLVVDDDVPLARAFALALESEGYVVHTAHSAEDGLRLAQREHPEAIMLDLRMPFINGAGFLYRLRASSQHNTPVMVVTGGDVNAELHAELVDLGAVLRFKPLGMADLITAMGAMVSDPPGRNGARYAPVEE